MPADTNPPAHRAHANRRTASALALAVSMACLQAQAGPLPAQPELGGEASVGVWSSTRMLDDRKGLLTGRARLELAWDASQSIQFRGAALLLAAPERLDGRRYTAQLTEFHLKAADLPCAPALGKRQVLWGRADGLNPTDQVSPTHFRRMVPRVADQREGRWGAHFDCLAGDGRLQLHVLDGIEFNAIPFDPSGPTTLREPRRDVDTTTALRYDRLGSRVDWSISAINGYDLFPTLQLATDTTAPSIDLVPTRMKLLGGDAAIAHGRWVFRGEAARVLFVQPGSPLQATRHSHTSAIAGAELALGERETISAQAFWKRLDSPPATTTHSLVAPLQRAQGLVSNEVERDQYGLTFRYATTLFESRTELDVFAVWGLSNDDWLLRGRHRHSLRDNLRLSTGFDLYRGPAHSYLGNLRTNSVAFVELDYLW